MELTVDPNCFIEKREGTSVHYLDVVSGERWAIHGVCSACGECEVGSQNSNLVWTGIPVGEPGACLDRTYGDPGRLDVPVRPELTKNMPHCTLWGEYL